VCVHFTGASVRLQVTDDGRGFDSKKTFTADAGHFGLVGMRERVEGVGGSFEITSSPADGTSLMIEVPVRPLSAGKQRVSVTA